MITSFTIIFGSIFSFFCLSILILRKRYGWMDTSSRKGVMRVLWQIPLVSYLAIVILTLVFDGNFDPFLQGSFGMAAVAFVVITFSFFVASAYVNFMDRYVLSRFTKLWKKGLAFTIIAFVITGVLEFLFFAVF